MNEYQQREATKYQKSLGRLDLIVKQLNELDLGDVTEFSIEPPSEDLDFTPRFICISALIMEGPIEIICERDGYGNSERWEFRASEWPSYTDENGSKNTIDPSSLWNPKANRPTTTAAQDRDPKAIAKQIASKILPEYIEIYKRCLERAQDAQGYANKTEQAINNLVEVCQDESHYSGRGSRSFYVRHLPGESVLVEFRSIGDCKVALAADEMVDVIEFLRKRRAA